MRLLKRDPGGWHYETYIQTFWPSWFDSYDKVYKVAGEIESRVPGEAVVQAVANQWRLQTALQFIQMAMPGYAHLLDFGCSRAAHAINIHNATGNKRFTCLDIDALSIREAQGLVSKLAKFPSMFDFVVGDEATALPAKQYDGALLFEVLEHVTDLRFVIDKVEASVKDGGWIFASVPSGAIEYDMWVEHPERLREHIREITLDDIYDLFGNKDNLHVQYASFGKSKYLDMLNGCYFFAYRVGKPTGKIDWERKLSTERKFEGELPGWH